MSGSKAASGWCPMIIPSQESISVEFKSDVRRLSDDVILDTVVAFENTNGGVLYLGVEDDGTPTGVHKTHRDATRLAAFIANKTVPPVSVRVSPEMVSVADGKTMVIAVEVPKSSAVVATASGKMLRRRVKFDGAPESVPMYPHEIVSRLSKLRSYDYSAVAAPGATVEDLDPNEM
ncbi:MAG: ATP-binding protein [Coriobacteriales bacterium]|nr:ATP-binding protein [Coriobacteriales bacterium]